MKKVMIFIVVCLFTAPLFASGPAGLTIEIDKKKLEAGKLQVFTEKSEVAGKGKKKRVIGVLLFDAPPEKLWGAICDWESMSSYVPGLNYYKIKHVVSPLKQSGITGKALIEGEIRVALMGIKYTLAVTFDNDRFYQDWRLISDDEIKTYGNALIKLEKSSSSIQAIEGYGYIEPYSNGEKSVYYYSTVVETNVPVPGFVERGISKSSLKGYMKGLKKKMAKSEEK